MNVKHCVLALLKKPKSISKNGSFQEILIRSLFLISNALLFCLICAPGSVWIKRSAWGTFTERSKKEVSLSWLNASDKWVCNKMTLFHKLLQKTIDMLSFEQCLLLVGMQKECKYCCRCITSFWIIHGHAHCTDALEWSEIRFRSLDIWTPFALVIFLFPKGTKSWYTTQNLQYNDVATVSENHSKSLVLQHCERSKYLFAAKINSYLFTVSILFVFGAKLKKVQIVMQTEQ